MTEIIKNKFLGLKNVISNTPLLDIKYKYCGKGVFQHLQA